MMRSHVQVPRFLLKRFEDHNIGKVHYYNLAKNCYGATSCKRLGIDQDYYNLNTEKLLSSKFEKPMAELSKDILTFCQGEEERLIITNAQIGVIKQYLLSLMGRSILFEKSVAENSYFAQLLRPQVVREYSIISVINNKDSDSIPFQKFHLGIIYIDINSRTFIIPRNGFYTVLRGEEGAIVIPISPKVAVTLVPSNGFFDLIADDHSVDYLNLRALASEKLYNNSFVAAQDKKELLRIVSKAEEIGIFK